MGGEDKRGKEEGEKKHLATLHAAEQLELRQVRQERREHNSCRTPRSTVKQYVFHGRIWDSNGGDSTE